MKNFGLVVAGGLLSLGAFAADDGVTLGGYIDAGYNSFMIDKVAGTKVTDSSGFLVKEGALYVTKKWGTEWEAYGDFSFMSDFNGASNTVGVSQAFIMQSMENGFSWKLGKFDTIYGYYAGRGDSHAHRLNDTGFLQGYFPKQHNGWLGAYSFSDMLKFSVVAANDSDAGGKGTANPDLGFSIGADFDKFTANGGMLFTTGEVGTKSKMGYLGSLVIEGNFKPLMVGAYGMYSKNDVDASKGDFGVGVNVGYDVDEKIGLNLRGEYLNIKSNSITFPTTFGTTIPTAFGANEIENAMGLTFGGQYAFAENVKAKVDYTYFKMSVKNVTIDPAHIVQAGVVANF